MLGDTVTNATTAGYALNNQEVDIIGGPPPVLIGFHGNTATWDNSHLNNSAIGIYMNGVQTIIGGTTITHAKIGIEVQNSSFATYSANTSLPIPIVPVIAAAMNITGQQAYPVPSAFWRKTLPRSRRRPAWGFPPA